MQYLVVEFHLQQTDPYRDLLVDALGNEGPYDSFEETADGVKAYVPQTCYDEKFLYTVLESLNLTEVRFETCVLPDKNWNEEWERGHKPVLVEGFCWVRAPFHERRDDVVYDVVIEPKMSFGTAHHATTYMMLSYLRDIELTGCRVLDMGCGTGVLAILAAMRGAQHVDAVDIDEWAYRNAVENVERNGVGSAVRCYLGDTSLLSDVFYDVVMANINRNILLTDMPRYSSVLKSGGVLFLSGFYHADVAAMQSCAAKWGLQVAEERTRDDWSSLRLVKR
ncbi:MAG: ribosomal protein L11 methyltransferase [bacterium P3]|nr:MAG: ribosomal protein L11 methyltransferase [bacterium P3]KWW42040.1 MAG: ribosomal protein L11 methyltransferase [bacterium F083]